MRIFFENNQATIKITLPKEELKTKMYETKTKYKKFMKFFYDKYYNDSFMGLALISYTILLRNMLFQINRSIDVNMDLTHDENNFYIRVIFLDFYGENLDDMTTEQLEFYFKNKMLPQEKDVLERFVEQIPTDKTIMSAFEKYLELYLKVDGYIKQFKDAIEEDKEKTKEEKQQILEDNILKILFNEFYIYVLKDSLKTDEDFLEEHYGK